MTNVLPFPTIGKRMTAGDRIAETFRMCQPHEDCEEMEMLVRILENV